LEGNMNLPCILHEDAFYEYFKPEMHPEAECEVWGGHGLEAFGHDLEIIRRYDPVFVWTVIDGSAGPDQWIIPGIHHVNRVCHLTTEVPHNWVDIEFRIPHRMGSLTELGLKRQLSKLRKVFAASVAA